MSEMTTPYPPGAARPSFRNATLPSSASSACQPRRCRYRTSADRMVGSSSTISARRLRAAADSGAVGSVRTKSLVEAEADVPGRGTRGCELQLLRIILFLNPPGGKQGRVHLECEICMSDELLSQSSGPVHRLTLNRAARRNA